MPAMARPTADPMMPLSESGASTTRPLPKRACSPSVARRRRPIPHVFAEHHHTLVARHFEFHGVANGFDDRHLGHQRPSSMAWRCAASRGGISAKTCAGSRRPLTAAWLAPRPTRRRAAPDVPIHVLADLSVHTPRRCRYFCRRNRSSAAGITHAGRLASGAVVRCGVHAEAIGHRLDQRGAVAVAGARHRLAHHVNDSEEIVAVDANTRDAVGDSLLGDRGRCRLQLARRRNRPVVVLAEEDDRRFHDAREVDGFVKVPLRRGALTEMHDDHIVFAAEAEAPGESGRVRNLSRDRRVEGQHPQRLG